MCEKVLYEVDQLLTELGIGEALISALDSKGRPTPLAHTYLRAPQSRMDILSNREIDAITDQSTLIRKYNEEIDRESAYEILTGKIEDAQSNEAQEKLMEQNRSARKTDSHHFNTYAPTRAPGDSGSVRR